MNEHLTYTIILRWDEQQSVYVGQATEIVGVEGSGSTYEEALASVLEAMRTLAGDERQTSHPTGASRAPTIIASARAQRLHLACSAALLR